MRKNSELVMFTRIPEYHEDRKETTYYGKLLANPPYPFVLNVRYLDKEKADGEKEDIQKGSLVFSLDVEEPENHYGMEGVLLPLRPFLREEEDQLLYSYGKELEDEGHLLKLALVAKLFFYEDDEMEHLRPEFQEILEQDDIPLPPICLVRKMYGILDSCYIMEMFHALCQYAGFVVMPVMLDLEFHREGVELLSRRKRKILQKCMKVFAQHAGFSLVNAKISALEGGSGKKVAGDTLNLAASMLSAELLKEVHRMETSSDLSAFFDKEAESRQKAEKH